MSTCDHKPQRRWLFDVRRTFTCRHCGATIQQVNPKAEVSIKWLVDLAVVALWFFVLYPSLKETSQLLGVLSALPALLVGEVAKALLRDTLRYEPVPQRKDEARAEAPSSDDWNF